MYKSIAIAFLLCAPASGQVMRQNGAGALTGQSLTPATVTASTITINNDGSGSACLAIGSTFTVNCQTGRVGIGTSNPATKVHYSSGVLTGDGTGAGIDVFGTHIFRDANTPLVTIRRNNNVGATSQPGALEVRAPNASGTDTQWGSWTVMVGTAAAGAEGSEIQFTTQKAGGVNTTLDLNQGNVGIGTTAPATKLHVSSGGMILDGTAPTMLIGPTNVTPAGTGGGGIHISGLNDSGVAITNPSSVDMELRLVGTTGQVGTFDDHPMTFMQNGVARITAAAGGNLGIGTTAPATKLHMSSGTLTVDGSGGGETFTNLTNGNVLCAAAGGVIGHCSAAASCTGTCTCTCVAN